MVSQRSQEAVSWDPPATIDLNDEGAVRYWTGRLQVTRLELEEVVDRVGLRAAAVATECGQAL